jgi:hypothetical protein
MRSARVAAGRTGTVVLDLRLADGPPVLALGRDNVALLHVPHADLRMSQ